MNFKSTSVLKKQKQVDKQIIVQFQAEKGNFVCKLFISALSTD